MTPLGITPKRIASSLKLGSAMVYERAKHMNSLSADTMLKVEQYYLITLAWAAVRSRPLQGTKSRSRSNFCWIRWGICTKNSNQNILHIRYHPPRLWPSWVVKPTPKDRDACLCQAHKNGQLLADRLYFLGLVDTKHQHIEDLAASPCCDISSKACAYRECKNCKENTLHLKPYDEQVSTTWYQWQPDAKQYVKPGQEKVQTANSIINQSSG